jgi:23S rRNA pseudoU1915 N3-methylase RlmH
MQPKLKPPGTQSLKLKCDDILLSTSAFRFNLRRYGMVMNHQVARIVLLEQIYR